MPLTGHMRPKIGPFYLNVSMPRLVKGQWPVTSWGISIGRYTRNFTHSQTSLDLPGPLNWRSNRH